ncbi:unnamed protein product [Rotaria sordida]|uniref:AP-3 complex subunit delta domain-containing protein n=1 Tax=Rotaria sordida TaxID=392033 RepID=A0A814D3R7_9BILA|nr:unnamed protein product [Rotaria sordida]CAF3945393.1 unnamed protein product [Rotaria sordida]
MVNHRKKERNHRKKSDTTVIDDNDDDYIYPTVKVTRGGELPERATESGNEDNDHDGTVRKNKKYDPHQALNIDLNETPIQSIPTPPPQLTSQLKEPVPKQVETLPIVYSINSDPSIAQLDVVFLLKNRTSFIIDHRR